MTGKRPTVVDFAAAVGARLRLATLGVLLPFAAASAPVTTPSPQAPIVLQGTGPYYRLVLPTGLYAQAAFEDLRDVRIRNGAGQPVPFAWLDSPVEPAAPAPGAPTPVPFFAVPVARTDPAAVDPAPGLRIRTDGSLVVSAADATRARPDTTTTEWLLDASRVAGDLVQATFTLAAGDQGVFPFALDASDDLRRWRPLVDRDALVRLDQSGRHIERLAVELAPGPARYLRLRWLDPGRTATLAGVALDSSRPAPAAAPLLEWSAGVPPSSCTADHCDYPAPRSLPIESLRIALAEPNTLATVRLSTPGAGEARRSPPRNLLFALHHRHRAGDAVAPGGEWPLVETVLYRLDAPGGGAELRSPAVTLDGAAHGVLRLRVDGGSIAVLGPTPPTLSFGARPRALVFLASGQPPFALSWRAPGSAAPGEATTAVPLGVLMPGRPVDKPSALATGSASVSLPAAPVAGPQTAKAPAAGPSTSNPPWLWAALALGLAVLGAMAWSLLRGIRTVAAPGRDDGR